MANVILLLCALWLVITPRYTVQLQPNQQPNIVFILTDDQDTEIGGVTPITKAKKLIGDAGAVFKNAFTSSPLCCPSRSSILTGNYIHNNGALNNSMSGNCSSPAWQNTAEKLGFITLMKKLGYHTFFAGKYLNEYGASGAGGTKHVPPGWDEWNGLVGNSVYYNYTLSVNGVSERHGDNYEKDYLTNVIAERAVEFLTSHEKKRRTDPFFMMLSTPACHAPWDVAPQYMKSFEKVEAPRNGSYNHHGADKHWLVRTAKNPMSNVSVNDCDDVYRKRWRTLLSVDDLVEQVVTTLEKLSILNDTYIFYTSDNGFHLGQMSLPRDKRQMYEFDIRVPLMVRGPNITAGQHRSEIIVNIDYAPTFMDLGGLPMPPFPVDGRSFKEILLSDKPAGPSSWRTDFLVEHTGEVQQVISDCPGLSYQNVSNCIPDCVCEDALNNTYGCVRSIDYNLNMVYCEFADDENFVEVYDLAKDPYQLTNIAKQVDPKLMMQMNKRLMKLSICSGKTCQSTESINQKY